MLHRDYVQDRTFEAHVSNFVWQGNLGLAAAMSAALKAFLTACHDEYGSSVDIGRILNVLDFPVRV